MVRVAISWEVSAEESDAMAEGDRLDGVGVSMLFGLRRSGRGLTLRPQVENTSAGEAIYLELS